MVGIQRAPGNMHHILASLPEDSNLKVRSWILETCKHSQCNNSLQCDERYPVNSSFLAVCIHFKTTLLSLVHHFTMDLDPR